MGNHTLQLGVPREPITMEMLAVWAEEVRTTPVPRPRHRASRWVSIRAGWTEFRLTFREAVGMIRDTVLASPEAALWVVMATCLLGATIGASR